MSYHHGNLRQALLRRAAEVITEGGVEALSLRALARDLGVSHAAPGRHFPDKAALLSALAEEGHVDMVAVLDEAEAAAGDDPVARYNAIGKALVRFALENPAYYRAMSHPDVHRQASPELLGLYREYMQRLHDAAAAAQAKGWLPGRSTTAAVLFSTAAAEGIAHLLTEPLDPMAVGDIDHVAMGEEIIDMVIPPHSRHLEGNGK